MISDNHIAVVDLETTSKDKTICEIVQIACLIVEPKLLKVVDKFYAEPRAMKPELVEDEALAVSKTTREDALSPSRPDPKTILKSFKTFLKKWGKTGMWGKPVMGGHNIIGFDKFILDRLCQEYKVCDASLFHPVYQLDTLHMVFALFHGQGEPSALNMDYLRKYLGLNGDGGHNALFDCEQSAAFLIRSLKWFRQISPRSNFANSFKDWTKEQLYAQA